MAAGIRVDSGIDLRYYLARCSLTKKEWGVEDGEWLIGYGWRQWGRKRHMGTNNGWLGDLRSKAVRGREIAAKEESGVSSDSARARRAGRGAPHRDAATPAGPIRCKTAKRSQLFRPLVNVERIVLQRVT